MAASCCSRARREPPAPALAIRGGLSLRPQRQQPVEPARPECLPQGRDEIDGERRVRIRKAGVSERRDAPALRRTADPLRDGRRLDEPLGCQLLQLLPGRLAGNSQGLAQLACRLRPPVFEQQQDPARRRPGRRGDRRIFQVIA